MAHIRGYGRRVSSPHHVFLPHRNTLNTHLPDDLFITFINNTRELGGKQGGNDPILYHVRYISIGHRIPEIIHIYMFLLNY